MLRSRITRLLSLVAAVAAIFLFAGPAEAATTVHWGMNEQSGPMLDDSGGNPGTWEDITPGTVGGASGYLFNGSSSRVVVSSSSSLIPGAADFTYSVRFSTTVVPSATVGDFDLLRKGLGETKGGYFKVELYPNSAHTRARALCQAKGRSSAAKLVGTTNLADGALHTITCEKQVNAFNMYVDGVLKASKSTTLGSITSTQPLTMGAKNIGGDWYEGFMDEASLTIS